MSDLVERLREYAEGVEYSSDERILKEAADRIAQLESDLSDALTDLNTARQDNASCTVHIHIQAARIERLEKIIDVAVTYLHDAGASESAFSVDEMKDRTALEERT